jgi:hypothetical protein
MMAIANVGLDDPPAAVELAVRRCAHADAANSFGSRVRLWAVAAKLKAHPTRSHPRNLVCSSR